jgi:phospholipid:diacylglycerol acyltransferase
MKDMGDLPYVIAVSGMNALISSTDFADVWSSIPSNLDPRDLLNNITVLDSARKALENRDFQVGESAIEKHKLKKKHPMVLIPGIVSTGLESWSTETQSRGFFRKRVWVSLKTSSISGADRYRALPR